MKNGILTNVMFHLPGMEHKTNGIGESPSFLDKLRKGATSKYLAAVLALGAPAMQSCELFEQPEPVEQVEQEESLVGVIRQLESSKDDAMVITGYETHSGNYVPTRVQMDLTKDTPLSHTIERAIISLMAKELPDHFTTNSTLADVDTFLAANPDALILNSIGFVDGNILNQGGWHDSIHRNFTELLTQDINIDELILQNSKYDTLLTEFTAVVNGEQVTRKRPKNAITGNIVISISFHSNQSGSLPLISATVNKNPVRYRTWKSEFSL